MNWALFWFAAFCFVTTLLVLDNMEGLRAWARRFLSGPAKTSHRASRAASSPTSPSSADEFVRQAADAAARARAANEIGRKAANASGSATAHSNTAPNSNAGDVTVQNRVTVGSVLAFLWKWKFPLLALALFIAGVGVLRSCSSLEFGKSKDTLRAERDAALIDKTVAEHEADMGRTAVELAENTHADTARVRDVVARAEEELADAVELADFDALWSAYDRAYRGVWALGPGEDFPDPPPGRPDSLRGAGADLA